MSSTQSYYTAGSGVIYQLEADGSAFIVRRYTIIADWNKDEWSGFADLLANLIEKYTAVLDVENIPEPPICFDN